MKERALPPLNRLRLAERRSNATATEPASVFVVKSLLLPVVSVATLVLCLKIFRAPLHGPYFLVAVLSFLASAELLDGLDFYGPAEKSATLRALLDIVVRWILVIGFVGSVLHLSRIANWFQPRVLTVWAVFTPLALWGAESVTRRVLSRDVDADSRVRRAIIIGLTEPGLSLERQFASTPTLRTHVVGFFEDRNAERLGSQGLERILGRSSDAPEFVRRNQISAAYITLPMTDHPRIQGLLDKLSDTTVSVYFVPNLSVYELVHARFDIIGKTPVFAVRESPFYGATSILKRLSDVLIAAMALIFLSPVLLFVAAGVRLSSPGPVLFKQRRYGLDGREILIYKFRSMTVTEDGATTYTQVTRQDSRVTSFGSFIRRLSLDELPQLLNVLLGTLSIVGPRPHAIAVNEQYRKLIPGYMLRHKIKPGITGWAQINGYRGGDDLESMRKRVEFDMEYLRNWSLLLDLAILMRTAAVVLKDKSAY